MATTRRNLILAAVAVVVVLAAIAVALGGGDDEPASNAVAEVGEPTVSGPALPELDDPADDPAVGSAAPSAEGVDFTGEPVTLQDGKLIAFVAHWCPHCQAEIPRLVEWMEAGDLPEDAIQLVSTSVDESAPNYPPSAWLEDERWTGDVLLDSADGAVARAYGVSGFPFFVAVDGAGEVTARVSGELTLEQVQALLATVG